MSLAIRNINPSYTAHSIFGETADNALVLAWGYHMFKVFKG